jgi:cytochrome c-type biogenesis protein CcmE
MTRKKRRLVLIGSGLGVAALALALMLYGLSGGIRFFDSPTDIVEKHVAPGTRVRLGGMVKEGSVVHGSNLAVRFEVTDGANSIPVSYQGILPDLFREGQGVVTDGVVEPDGFKADAVLAKHDENYMPKAVANVLKRPPPDAGAAPLERTP